MKKYAILACFLLSSCAVETETVTLAKGSSRVQCGPYSGTAGNFRGQEHKAALLESRMRDCVSDFQRQGYERVASP